MRIGFKKTIIGVFLLVWNFNFGQNSNTENWTETEKSQYLKFNELAIYVHNKEKSEISHDVLFEKFIFFNYVLNDTITKRKERRLEAFDTIFSYFRQTVNSIGLKNLDIKPVRFYKNHEIYKPFKKDKAKKTIRGEKMSTKDSNVFAYYRKEDPENPLGTLLFEPNTYKMVAWIMLDQGGTKYFLTFNLL